MRGWYIPAAHSGQLPTGATNDSLLKVPGVQLAHTRFDIAVGDTDSNCPGLHTVSAAQVRLELAAVQLPVMYSVVGEHDGIVHGVHCMSAVAVNTAVR